MRKKDAPAAKTAAMAWVRELINSSPFAHLGIDAMDGVIGAIEASSSPNQSAAVKNSEGNGRESRRI
jgi:hypothetical protein